MFGVLSLITTQSYSGKWMCEDESSSFRLTLHQTDSIVMESHWAVNGNRIGDEDVEETL